MEDTLATTTGVPTIDRLLKGETAKSLTAVLVCSKLTRLNPAFGEKLEQYLAWVEGEFPAAETHGRVSDVLPNGYDCEMEVLPAREWLTLMHSAEAAAQ